MILAILPARSADVDADGAIGLGDLAHVARNFISQSLDQETNFDNCGSPPTNLADWALFTREYLRQAGVPLCP